MNAISRTVFKGAELPEYFVRTITVTFPSGTSFGTRAMICPVLLTESLLAVLYSVPSFRGGKTPRQNRFSSPTPYDLFSSGCPVHFRLRGSAPISNADIMRYSLRACSLCFTASIIVSILPVYSVFTVPVLTYSKKPLNSLFSAFLKASAFIITFFVPSRNKNKNKREKFLQLLFRRDAGKGTQECIRTYILELSG